MNPPMYCVQEIGHLASSMSCCLQLAQWGQSISLVCYVHNLDQFAETNFFIYNSSPGDSVQHIIVTPTSEVWLDV